MHKTTLIDISIQVEKIIIKINDDIKRQPKENPLCISKGGYLGIES